MDGMEITQFTYFQQVCFVAQRELLSLFCNGEETLLERRHILLNRHRDSVYQKGGINRFF